MTDVVRIDEFVNMKAPMNMWKMMPYFMKSMERSGKSYVNSLVFE